MAPKKKVGQILSPSEVGELKAERKELENTLTQSEFGKGTPAEQIDRVALNSQIRRIDSALEAGSAPKVNGRQKDELAKEAQRLEEHIKAGMPTYDEMRSPNKFPGAITKNQMWEKRNGEAIQRWKQIQRTLEPGRDSNIERLRGR